MTDVYQIKAEIAMQYEHGWMIAQENFNRYLYEHGGHEKLGKRVRRSFSSTHVNK
ncbi:hypothetical protein WJR50_21145 [Catalinimonas sp. 4WD22]|jgi:hypothetical protein|uniref:hypothetical protein n=1 Tax=Catalinimonas locisalis TaxID=3133978 RepID=UPI00310190C3